MSNRRRGAEATAAAEVLPFPKPARPKAAQRARWLPSSRSVLLGLGIVAVAAGAYFVARETSAFALNAVEVNGASPEVAGRIRQALGPMAGTSLLAFDRAAAARRVLALPAVASVRFNRDFPHRLRVTVQLERAAAVLRQGSLAWSVATDARVLGSLTRPYPALPRIWVPRSVDLVVGSTLGGHPAQAVRAVAPLLTFRFPVRVRSVLADDTKLTLVLASGTEVRLGDTGDLRLKLAVAKRILPLVPEADYVDVSVPERAVAHTNPQPVG